MGPTGFHTLASTSLPLFDLLQLLTEFVHVLMSACMERPALSDDHVKPQED